MLGLINTMGNKTEHCAAVYFLYFPLEFSVQFWSSHLKQIMVDLEKVQKRATSMIQGVVSLLYRKEDARLEKRYVRVDRLAAYKIMGWVDKNRTQLKWELRGIKWR